MSSLINGEVGATLPAADRATQYGDAVFETIAVRQGRPLLWERHWWRLTDGLTRLKLPQPKQALLRAEAEQLCAGTSRGVLKVLLTAGVGGRGYRRPDAPNCQRILSLHPYPDYSADLWTEGVAVRCCQMQLARQPALAGLKHGNRLEQVLARAEWTSPEISEGLMCDTDGNLIEGTMSNVFAVRRGKLLTPSLEQCGVAGIMRECILELAVDLGVESQVETAPLETWLQADELFLSNSVIGIWPVRQVDAQEFRTGPLSRQLQNRIIEQGLAPIPTASALE
ncbi:aminodeoxychorismate lyase [Methylonatrum kenyense]|uniref:aminodeoxychorismate lyase n=1 Tax=Methylonatrum kenyense TaxID=455253 RepID=UPI0020BED5FF|nr:aminodeoxychorismate lyase [Methylonatrum kenyense]MCK8516498.1 aminodeoxychorismate lyase [Methylonatrum kenyense]